MSADTNLERSGGLQGSDTISLFRQESFRRSLSRLEGDVVLTSKPIILRLAVVLPSVMILTLIFVGTLEFPRVQAVKGWLTTTSGLITLEAPAIGVVERTFAKEGAEVARGQAVLQVKLERAKSLDGRTAESEMVRLLERQASEIREQIRLSEAQGRVLVSAAKEEIKQLESEISYLDQQINLSKRQVASAQEDLTAATRLLMLGIISVRARREREDKVLAAEQSSAFLGQQRSSTLAKLHAKRRDAESVDISTSEGLSRLRQQLAQIARDQADLANRQQAVLVAPVAGKISFVAQVGTATGEQLPLATIIPGGGELDVELFLSSGAIGFVAPGQRVRLLYDAFPYQKFGSFPATITSVSASTVRVGSNTPYPITEPVYLVHARPDRSTVTAYGARHSLRPGMTLNANVVLESRPLIMWLFDPLVSVRERS